MQFCAAHKSRGNCMRNWGHNTLRVGVSPLWMSDCSVACRSAWRSLCGASPSGQATAVHRAPRSGPSLEACPCDPVPPTPSIPAAYFGLRRGFCTIRSILSACRRRVAPLLLQFPPFSVGVIGRRVAPGSSYRAILPFGSALNVGRARPCASHGAIPPFGGGFAPLEASLRRVAGVSRLYCCNSPRLLAVRSRFGVVWRPQGRPPRRRTLTTGGLWASCPASWWQRCLASCVTRTFTPEM